MDAEPEQLGGLASGTAAGLHQSQRRAKLAELRPQRGHQHHGLLDLPDYAADGYTNVTFDSGSVSFWCQANWTSASDGGTGPGAWAPLWQVGTFSTNPLSGCWSVAVSPDGNTLAFVTQTNGAGEIHAQIPIVWDAGDWHNLVITYCATNSSIYFEGALVTNMPPIVYWPGSDVCASGFYVGSDPAGTLQARAQFQELETYGVPLDADFIKDNYDSVADEILAWGGSLPAAGAGGIGGITQAAGPPTLPGMGGGTNSGGTNSGGGYIFNYTLPSYGTNSCTAYDQYTNFWLAVGTSGSNTQVALTIQNTLSNLTYEILTNSVLDTNLADWGVWQVLTASNSVIVAPPFAIGSNSLFFASQLVLITGTNQIADWWQMKYFGQLGVDPYADPDLDGLCNYSEYILGSNPTNAHSMSASKTDAEYFFLAYTNDSSTRMLLFQSNGPGTNAVTLDPVEYGSGKQLPDLQQGFDHHEQRVATRSWLFGHEHRDANHHSVGRADPGLHRRRRGGPGRRRPAQRLRSAGHPHRSPAGRHRQHRHCRRLQRFRTATATSTW